ncbi:hypothetical protein ACGE24_01635 [Corynebacterium kroppenstedtii]|uniref:hypothetical protein n=1 Tax=Corynebacterium sp. PCR 32 TaxID=3351342 RepID=UPI0030AD8141
MLVAVGLVMVFHWLGFGLLVTGMAVAAYIARSSNVPAEQEQLRRSIELSAADIKDVLGQWHEFRHGTSHEVIADRSSHPSLVDDAHADNPVFRRFHQAQSSSQLFIEDLDGVVANARSIHMLEHVLAATDEIANELRQSWQAARRYARDLDQPTLRLPPVVLPRPDHEKKAQSSGSSDSVGSTSGDAPRNVEA